MGIFNPDTLGRDPYWQRPCMTASQLQSLQCSLGFYFEPNLREYSSVTLFRSTPNRGELEADPLCTTARLKSLVPAARKASFRLTRLVP